MRKLTFLILTAVTLCLGCSKDDDPGLSPQEQLAEDIRLIEEYLLANEGSVAQKTASGLHYIIREDGDGTHPSATSEVEVKYNGYLLDGTVFDKTAPTETITFFLNRTIPGWIEGIPLIESGGGKGTLYIPSGLGYGSNSPSRLIPANSVLIFDVTVISFQ